jgi:hypothetical protein
MTFKPVDRGRRYNEKQVGSLIQRATELHEERTGESERGLTLAEIEKIAAELGLPVQDMRTAALEMESEATGDSGLDRRFSVSQALVVDGEMTEDQWSEFLLELRSFTGRSGTVTDIGKAREWTHYLGEGSDGVNFTRTQVLVQPKKGQTSVQIQDHFGIGRLFYPIGFVTGAVGMLIIGEAGLSQLAFFAELPAIVGFSATALSAGAGVYGAHLAVKAWAAKKKERLGVLAERLRRTLTSDSVADSVTGANPVVETHERGAEAMDSKDSPEILGDAEGYENSESGPTKDGLRT